MPRSTIKTRLLRLMCWKDKNYGKSPFDPDYDDRYDAEADKEAYDEACEERERRRREDD